MWVTKFKLKDDEDIYSPVCQKYKVEFFAVPYTQFTKDGKINVLVGGVISGGEENKKKFVDVVRKDNRVQKIERYHDFVLVHAQHTLSREIRAEIKIFYNPQYIRVKPVKVASDGWEYWELACLEREELNKIVQASQRYYHGKLISFKQEKFKNVTSLDLAPHLTEKQLSALKTAFKEGYYNYPRKLTIAKLAQMVKKSYSTVQEHLSKAENSLVEYFVKYR